MRYVLAQLCFFLTAGSAMAGSADVSRLLASGAVGCAPAEIGISNESSSRGIHTFTAHCKGLEFFCTYKYPAPIVCTQPAGTSPEEIEKSRNARAEAMKAWKVTVIDRVQSVWKKPNEFAPSMSAKVAIKVDAEGELENIAWVTKTGNKSVDRSILKAFDAAQPYPKPPDLGEAFAGVEMELPATSPAEK